MKILKFIVPVLVIGALCLLMAAPALAKEQVQEIPKPVVSTTDIETSSLSGALASIGRTARLLEVITSLP